MKKDLIILHLVILIFGFTGIFGKLISISAEQIVWFRMAIAFLSIGVFLKFRKIGFKSSKKSVLQFLGAGVIVALHWITFFQSIKVSNVSVGLISLSSASLFVAILEPILTKRKWRLRDLLFGFLIIPILGWMFYGNLNYLEGIIYGVISAFLAALFTILNGQFIQHNRAEKISFYEMLGGFLIITAYFGFTGQLGLEMFNLSFTDISYLLILGIICTAFAFVAATMVMKTLSPFTVAFSVNLEPVYGILLALLIFGDSEFMQTKFYIGAILIISMIILNGDLKPKVSKKIY